MFIRSVDIGHYRQIADVKLGPYPEPAELSELITLAGPNGSGKSSVLELISFGLTSRYSWQYFQSRTVENQSFAIQIGLSDEEIGAVVDQARGDVEVTEFVEANRGYWLQVNRSILEGSEFQTNERVHGIVTRQYQNFSKRLGFFIRSDRSYERRNYDTRHLFSYRNREQPSHFGSLSYSSSNNQYADMYDFLVEQSYHYVYKLGAHHKAIAEGGASASPEDPLLPYNDLLNRVFPGYRIVSGDSAEFNLKVQLPSGNIINFFDLSSGEREVFFVLSFFIRHNVRNSIIIIDEPELHLHPELARRLVRQMRSVRPHNQIWLATHNADLIDETGRDRTIFLRSSEDRTRIEFYRSSDEAAEIGLLRDMFGVSGYVGLANKIVFVEGQASSIDRKTFLNLLPNYTADVKIVPVGSVENIYRINAAILRLIESQIMQCKFFLIRDRDYLTVDRAKAHAKGHRNFYVLNRCQIENYLLNENVISEILRSVYGRKTTPEQVAQMFVEIARINSASVLRDMVVARISELYQPEDCSIGKHSSGLAIIDREGNSLDEVLENLKAAIFGRLFEVNNAVSSRTTGHNPESIFNSCVEEVKSALLDQNEAWKSIMPGKMLLSKFASKYNMGADPAFQNLIIERMSAGAALVPKELKDIFMAIAKA